MTGKTSAGAPHPTWSPERVGDLRRFWQEGLSTSEIGRRLGVSKNAVVGKAHRMELPPRASPISRRKQPVSADAGAARAAGGGAPLAFPRKGSLVPRVASSQTCQWPLGHPGQKGFHFCGKTVVMKGRPYCTEHHAIAYTTSPSSRSKDDSAA